MQVVSRVVHGPVVRGQGLDDRFREVPSFADDARHMHRQANVRSTIDMLPATMTVCVERSGLDAPHASMGPSAAEGSETSGPRRALSRNSTFTLL